MAQAKSWRRTTTAPRSEERRSNPSSQEEITRVAYGLYERRGRIDGHDWEDWFEAERLVTQGRQASGRSSR